MRSFLRYTILLSVLALLSISANCYNYGTPNTNSTNDIQEKGSVHYFSECQLNYFCPPHHSEALSIVGCKHSSGNTSKNASSIWGYAPAFEQRVKHVASEYIFKSYRIYQSLTISDIIFPFSYFW